MIDYYSLYRDTLLAIYYYQLKTGSDLLDCLLSTNAGREIQVKYPNWEVKEIIFYNLDCLIERKIVSAIELPISDKRIYTIEGLTTLGAHYLSCIGKNTQSAVENWHEKYNIYPTAHSVLDAFHELFF